MDRWVTSQGQTVKMGCYSSELQCMLLMHTLQKPVLPCSLTGFTIPKPAISEILSHKNDAPRDGARTGSKWCKGGTAPGPQECGNLQAEPRNLSPFFVWISWWLICCWQKGCHKGRKHQNKEPWGDIIFWKGTVLIFSNDVYLIHMRLFYSYRFVSSWRADHSMHIDLNPRPLDIPAGAIGRKADPVLMDPRGCAAWPLTDTPTIAVGNPLSEVPVVSPWPPASIQRWDEASGHACNAHHGKWWNAARTTPGLFQSDSIRMLACWLTVRRTTAFLSLSLSLFLLHIHSWLISAVLGFINGM